MGTPDAGVAEWKEGHRWLQMHEELIEWLVRRFRRRIDAANIAGDAVFLAFVRFGLVPEVAPGRIWRWICRTASNRVFADYRRSKRCDICFTNEPHVAVTPQVSEPTMAGWLVDLMLSTSLGVEHQVLKMQQVGSPSNEEMAGRIGVKKRTIERARAKLRIRYAWMREILVGG